MRMSLIPATEEGNYDSTHEQSSPVPHFLPVRKADEQLAHCLIFDSYRLQIITAYWPILPCLLCIPKHQTAGRHARDFLFIPRWRMRSH